MAIRTRFRLAVILSSDDREEEDLGRTEFEVVVDTQGEGGTWRTYVPGGAVDQPLQLTGVTSGKLLLIRATPRDTTDTPPTVSVKINLITNTPIPLLPLSASREAFLFVTADAISAVFISNAGPANCDVTVAMAGD